MKKILKKWAKEKRISSVLPGLIITGLFVLFSVFLDGDFSLNLFNWFLLFINFLFLIGTLQAIIGKIYVMKHPGFLENEINIANNYNKEMLGKEKISKRDYIDTTNSQLIVERQMKQFKRSILFAIISLIIMILFGIPATENIPGQIIIFYTGFIFFLYFTYIKYICFIIKTKKDKKNFLGKIYVGQDNNLGYYFMKDEIYTKKKEECPFCRSEMNRTGYADYKLDDPVIDWNSKKTIEYSYKRVGIYNCPQCGKVYGDSSLYKYWEDI